MQVPTARVVFDNGDTFTVTQGSRDALALERDGVDLETVPPMEATYRLIHATLKRLERTNQIEPSEPIPETWDALADVADILPDEDDPEGEGSGQAASTG